MDSDQKYYDRVASELQSGEIDAGLWTRAVAETSDEGARAKSLYIRMRIKKLEKSDSVVCGSYHERPEISREESDSHSENYFKSTGYAFFGIAFILLIIFLGFLLDK